MNNENETKAKVYSPLVEATLINELIGHIHIREAAKESMSGVEEIAVETYGDQAKGLKALAEGVYKATYKSEQWEVAREKKQREFACVDSRKGFLV